MNEAYIDNIVYSRINPKSNIRDKCLTCRLHYCILKFKYKCIKGSFSK